MIQLGVVHWPVSRSLFCNQLWHLERSNRTVEAIAMARKAVQVFPGDLFFRLREALLLPVVYSSAAERAWYRQRYSEGLDRLLADLDLGTDELRRDALRAIGHHDNFYVGYACENARDLMERYAALVSRVMEASYPHWNVPIETIQGGVLRVGYVSSCIGRGCSVMKTHLGWLREHDRNRVAVHVYDVRPTEDEFTEEVRRLSDRFHFFPNGIEETCAAIREERPHVLIYLDVGVRPVTSQLAALRLAPIQCASWDPPFTTGFRTIDYYLSAELNETDNAAEDYTEQLVLLPRVGVCFEKPAAPWLLLDKTRNDFGLREDSVLYACSQSILKYMPEQDVALARIAARVEKAQFVFLISNELVRKDFSARIERAFAAEGLLALNYCAILPECDWLTWMNLNRISDVFLDTFDWSGGVTSFEAVACGIPIVTLPGKHMRGRQSLGILRRLGVTDTVARDEDDYVDIAVRLGQDPQWRAGIARHMVAAHGQLYGDQKCVRYLEDFLEGVVKQRACI
jgi:protein O-GlcNAc transferase